LHEAIKDSFPIRKEARRWETHFEVKQAEDPAHTSSVRFVGYRLESKDGRKVWQVQHDGFTLSHLKPYDRWETLVDEAKGLWNLYADVAEPIAITRVATRFINRLELPGAGLDFDDYLTVAPRIPSALPQMFVEFLSRIAVPKPELGAMIVITQALEPATQSDGRVPVTIDIDAFKAGAFDTRAGEAWELLERLRSLKNDAFFGSITTRTLELYL
jgi:uncharacterized protein (TIGR04255 family)